VLDLENPLAEADRESEVGRKTVLAAAEAAGGVRRRKDISNCFFRSVFRIEFVFVSYCVILLLFEIDVSNR
jgi:hypothetical protein